MVSSFNLKVVKMQVGINVIVQLSVIIDHLSENISAYRHFDLATLFVNDVSPLFHYGISVDDPGHHPCDCFVTKNQ